MLIVIEGVDGSGKQTQSELIAKKLEEKFKVLKISFPNYESESSALVKMYLRGDFGANALDVNPYAASTFYAVDRAATYLKDLKNDFSGNTVIVADRYTTSNAIHQASKLSNTEKDEFLNWLFDFEYNLLGIPKPDLVFFLDVPPEYSKKLMVGRDNKITGNSTLDIHENNSDYLIKSYENALYIAKKYNWNIISCVENGSMRSIDDINREILDLVMTNI